MNSSRFICFRRAWSALGVGLALVVVGITPGLRGSPGTSWWVGGSGFWDASTANVWSYSNASGSASGPFDQAYHTSSNAIIGNHGSAGTITLGANIGASTVEFDSPG